MLSASTHHFSANSPALLEKRSPAALFQSAGLVVRRVTEQQDQLATDLLVRRMYSWRGYETKHFLSPLRDTDRVTLGVWQNGEIAATLTLSQDNERGLLCESLYPKEIADLRNRNNRICEYSRFAIDPEFSSQTLLDSLFRTAYYFTYSHFGATDAVVEVNPRHSRYYQRELGFTCIGPRRVCPRVDAPAMLLHRNLRQPVPRAWASSIAA